MHEEMDFNIFDGMLLEICRLCKEHARQVMEWRNDPVTLSAFYHKEPKVWEEFWPEFRDTYFMFPDLPPLFLRDSGARVAFIRFLPRPSHGCRGRVVDVSLNVGPAHRGRGLGIQAVRTALQFLALKTNIDTVVAEVRRENIASHKTFLAAGFQRVEDTYHTVTETGEVCAISRYTLDISRSASSLS
jgi:RimJ/RimL family protein N-acetyltransferase